MTSPKRPTAHVPSSGVDSVLDALWRALAEDKLTPDQMLQLRAMIRIADDEHPAAADDGEVKRRRRLGDLVRRFSGVMLALWRLIDLMKRLGWLVVAIVL